MNIQYPYLDDKNFLKSIDRFKNKVANIKISVLDWNENPIQDIEGLCTSGSISYNGDSIIRRTCSLTMQMEKKSYNIEDLNSMISINKKFKLSIGYTNFDFGNGKKYSEYETIWFPMGIYVFTTAAIAANTTGAVMTITAKDKMCLLNGEVSGELPFTINFGKIQTTDSEGNVTTEYPNLYTILTEALKEYGNESQNNIIVDVPTRARSLMYYLGANALYLDEDGNDVSSRPDSARYVINSGDLAGYRYDDFIIPTKIDVVLKAGDKLTSLFEKIKDLLGNYEYYYDIDGRFVFQEKRNYQYNQYVPITQIDTGEMMVNFSEGEIEYSFNSEEDFFTSANNNPNFLNIKNDFIAWGKKSSAVSNQTYDIHFRCSIDSKPNNGTGIPHQIQLYNNDREKIANGEKPSAYYTDMSGFFPNMVDDKDNPTDWKFGGDSDYKDSSSLLFWLEIIDENNPIGKYSVDAIGRRTKVSQNDDIGYIYNPEAPPFVLIPTGGENNSALIAEAVNNGYTPLQVNMNNYAVSSIGNDLYTVVRNMIVEHSNYAETISITTAPVFYLEPNTKIRVDDEKSNIHGYYIIKSISIPLEYKGLMTIQASRATTAW